MIEQERLERRIRLAKAMGYRWFKESYTNSNLLAHPERIRVFPIWKIQEHDPPIEEIEPSLDLYEVPDYDTDAAALLLLMEKMVSDAHIADIRLWQYPEHSPKKGIFGCCLVGIIPKYTAGAEDANTLSEAILQAIDAALQSRGKVNE